MSKSKTTRRLELGTSDPISYNCTCPPSTTSPPGKTLLFYRYFTKPPLLPLQNQKTFLLNEAEINSFSQYHTSLLSKWDLGGRIRLGLEGFNGTVAGSFEGINGWINEVCRHWSFGGLGLDRGDGGDFEERREGFFKPSLGCKCVFGEEKSVRIMKEITPMGVEGWSPGMGGWDGVVELEPVEWHGVFLGNGGGGRGRDRVLVDVRNYYESRIGYFVDPEMGKEAIRPAIRRFGQWPLWVRDRMTSVIGINNLSDGEETPLDQTRNEDKPKVKEIFTYCTGGIRCEKGVRYMQETLGEKGKVYTLKGGIAAYLIWMNTQISQGSKTASESLFRGRNYVFDARGSIGLEETEMEPVSTCQVCENPCDRLGKCRSKGCHLVLVLCEGCERGGDVGCCESCGKWGGDGVRPMCDCERERERGLWGGERGKRVRGQGWRKKDRGVGKVGELDIKIKTIEG